MKSILAAAIITAAIFLNPVQAAYAVTLDEAKSAAQVGETPGGYIESVIPNPSPELTALITDINNSRRAEYQAIAQKNGTPVAVVEALAGQKAIDRTPAGGYVKSDGKWVKK